MSGFCDDFIAFVVNDCINGESGPMDWTETEQAADTEQPDDEPTETIAGHFDVGAA